MTPATLALHFSLQDGGTAFRAIRQDVPWRALRAFPNAAGEALVHLHNVSGGVLGGDDLRLEATLDANTQAQITTVGATRVHRHRRDKPAACHATVFHVGADALLEYLPEPVIPFAGSRFSQSCEIHLSPGAGLIWWETVSAGRLAYNESFGFETFSAQTAVYSPEGPIALERYTLSPALRDIASPARMGRFSYSSTMYVCRADGSPRWRALESELGESADGLCSAEACWGVSSLVRDGIVIRGLATHAHQAAAGLQALWHAAKLAVWGRHALAPRKIY